MKFLWLILAFMVHGCACPGLAWNQVSSKVVQVDQASGVSSTPNYWKSGDAEVLLTGVAAYNDGASAKPVDCTGGSSTMTGVRSTTNPMYDKFSWLVSKPAGNMQGQGVAFEFDVDNGVAGVQGMDLLFDYMLASGTFTAGDKDTNSDLMIYLYDVTAGQLIEPKGGSKLLTSSTTVTGSYRGWFQSTLGSKKYRVCLHQATTSASSYGMIVDAGKVQKSKHVVGTIITDWESYTPTIAGLGAGSTSANLARYRRVGDQIEIVGRFVKDGTNGTGSTNLSIPIPTGLSIDNGKTTNSNEDLFGTVLRFTVASGWVTTSLVRAYGSSVRFVKPGDMSGQGWTGTDAPANSIFTYNFSVPILGWSAGARMSDLYSGQNIGAFIIGGGTGVTGVGSTRTKITGMSAPVDTVGMWDSTNQQLIIKATRNYRIDYGLRCESMTDAASFCQAQLYVDGSPNGNSIAQATTITLGKEIFPVHSVILPLKAGNILDLRGSISSGTATLGRFVSTYIRITEDSGTPFMSPTALWETHYAGTAGDTIGTSDSLIKFTTKVEDTFGSYNPATGLWTAKGPATCSFGSRVQSASVNLATNQRFFATLYKDGSPYRLGNLSWGGGVSVPHSSIIAPVSVPVVQGTTISVHAISSVATTAGTEAINNYFTVSCRQ